MTKNEKNKRMENKKYKLTDETMNLLGRTLYRIEALKDFNDVKKGEYGGFVESEDNLSQNGNCWIYNNAMVYDDAVIDDNACVYDNVCIFDNAHVYDNAMIYENAKVYGNVQVSDDAVVCGKVHLCGDVDVCVDEIYW